MRLWYICLLTWLMCLCPYNFVSTANHVLLKELIVVINSVVLLYIVLELYQLKCRVNIYVLHKFIQYANVCVFSLFQPYLDVLRHSSILNITEHLTYLVTQVINDGYGQYV